jgi:hypothetical protein
MDSGRFTGKRNSERASQDRQMAEPRSFFPVKLICGVIASKEKVISDTVRRLVQSYGNVDLESPLIPFDLTDYYEKQMGKDLSRKFLSFERLIPPERLSSIKLETNRMEEQIQEEFMDKRRIINIDPGYLTTASLIMATAKNFAHRVPLRDGIYAHLELLFGRDEVRLLDWTYPDFKNKGYQEFFRKARRIYLSQIKEYPLQ